MPSATKPRWLNFMSTSTGGDGFALTPKGTATDQWLGELVW